MNMIGVELEPLLKARGEAAFTWATCYAAGDDWERALASAWETAHVVVAVLSVTALQVY